MKNQVLLVDDEANLLQSFRRMLRGKYDIVFAEGGEAALQQLAAQGPFAVVVCDMQMPNVNGLQVLAEAKRRSPNTVRMMLTGNVDQQTAVDAVNDGAIYRFINKPCPAEKLASALDEAIQHYQLLVAEKEILSNTLAGCVGLVNELLSVASPKAFGRGGRIRQWTKQLCTKMQFQDAWQYEIAAMLSQVGSICHAEEKNKMDLESDPLAMERSMRLQSQTAGALIRHISRLENIADMITYQYASPPRDKPDCVARGSCMLRLLIDYDILLESRPADQAIRWLRLHQTSYDVPMLEALSEIACGQVDIREVKVSELFEGMILEKDVQTKHGEILLSNGHALSASMIQRLRSFNLNSIGVREPILVRVVSLPSVAVLPGKN